MYQQQWFISPTNARKDHPRMRKSPTYLKPAQRRTVEDYLIKNWERIVGLNLNRRIVAEELKKAYNITVNGNQLNTACEAIGNEWPDFITKRVPGGGRNRATVMLARHIRTLYDRLLPLGQTADLDAFLQQNEADHNGHTDQ